MLTKEEERWYSTDAFVAACTAAGKITEATGGMVATIDEINTFQELLKQQGFSILPIEFANQDKWVSAKELPDAKKVGNKVLLFRNMNDSQREMSMTVYDTFLVKHCDPETTFWQKLPNPPKQ